MSDINYHLDMLNDLVLNVQDKASEVEMQIIIDDYCDRCNLDPSGFILIIETNSVSVEIN